jgi:putative acetyltransferase
VVTDVKVRQEREPDRRQVRQVVQAAFRTQPVVADLVETLRASAGWRPSLSLVAHEHGAVAGHVMASRGWLDAQARLVNVLILSPLSVMPGRQGQGIGTLLVRQLLAVAASGTEPAIFLEGSPGYYGRFGFEAAGLAGFRRPSLRIPESAFQVRTFANYEPWMTGTLVYPEAFWELDCVGLR